MNRLKIMRFEIFICALVVLDYYSNEISETISPLKHEAQTALFKDPVRTAL